MIKTILLLSFICISRLLYAQPVPDENYVYKLSKRAYLPGMGPNVMIDEGHNNLHKKEEGLLPLMRILTDDGYNISSNKSSITDDVLSKTQLYVIVNPLHDSNVGNWVVPNPSAFSDSEIAALIKWVKKGGSLLLVADHMPYGGAVQKLGKELGVEWNNGFAIREGQNWPPSMFNRTAGTLKSSKITNGSLPFERVEEIASFTGSVFKAPSSAEVFLEFDDSHDIFMPDTAWEFNESTKTLKSTEWQQGASFDFGKGKVVILGEAAMITAQIVNDNFKVGINSPQAPENVQLALNIFHYLSRHKNYIDLNGLLDNNLRAMEEAYKTGRMSEVAAFYADDAQILGPNGNDQKGRNQIDQYWSAVEGIQVDWELTSLKRLEIGNQVHELGTSKLTYKSGGSNVISNTRFYLIWELINGQYKIKMDFYHVY